MRLGWQRRLACARGVPRATPVAWLATPLSLCFAAVDRRLCVPVSRRVCRLLTEGECRPGAAVPQRQSPETCSGSRFGTPCSCDQPMTFEATWLRVLSTPVCVYALIAKNQVPGVRFWTTVLVVAGLPTSIRLLKSLADVP